jgi:hypothetical protein
LQKKSRRIRKDAFDVSNRAAQIFDEKVGIEYSAFTERKSMKRAFSLRVGM